MKWYTSSSSASPLALSHRSWLVLGLVSTTYLIPGTHGITCSRCSGGKATPTFPVWSCFKPQPPADLCPPEPADPEPFYQEFGYYYSQQDCIYNWYLSTDCECADERIEIMGPDSPSGSCTEIENSVTGCDCEVGLYDWPQPFCGARQSKAYVCEDKMYVCWNLIPPQALGIVDDENNQCDIDNEIQEVHWCDSYAVNNFKGPGESCGTLCSDGTNCPNGKEITRVIDIANGVVPFIDDPESEYYTGFCLVETQTFPWTVSVTGGPTQIAGFDYSCPSEIQVDIAPLEAGGCGGPITFSEPSCQINYRGRRSGDVYDTSSPLPPGAPLFTAYFGGKYQTCKPTLKTRDVSLPTVSGCPGTINVIAEPGQCTAPVTYSPPTASTACTPSVDMVLAGQPSGSNFPIGTTKITYTTEGVQTASCTFDVIVNPTAPAITCPDNKEVAYCDAASVTYDPATAIGCQVSLTQIGPVSGSAFNAGTVTPITFIATDISGTFGLAQSSCVFEISVLPPGPPSIVCPTDVISVGWCDAQVTYPVPTSTGVCGESLTPTLESGLVSGSTFPVGTTPITFQATESSTGLSASCSFAIEVADPLPPGISCPADTTVGVCDAQVSYPPALSVSECGTDLIPNVTSGPVSGSTFPVGSTPITYEVTDPLNNLSNSCSFKVTVADTVPPVVTCSMTRVCGANLKGCKFRVVWDAVDSCNGVISGPVTVSKAQVESLCLSSIIPVTSKDQLIDWKSAGYRCPNGGNQGAKTAKLVIEVVDASGNTGSCEAVTAFGNGKI